VETLEEFLIGNSCNCRWNKVIGANQVLDNDFSTKEASDQIIYSHSYFNKILFVPINDYQPNFRISLMEKDSKKIKEVEVAAS
jgi:hypothetical protein